MADLLYFLDVRLKFIEEFYDTAISPFEGIARKIDEGEPPYVDGRDPEYVAEPAFLQEWQDAKDSVMTVGHWCFCMVHASLQAYLKAYIGPMGSLPWRAETLEKRLAEKKKAGRSWFERYRLLFLEDMGIDWNTGPVALADLEQMNLTRDDVTHNVSIFNLDIPMGDGHAEKYPTSLFTDDLWYGLTGGGRVRIDKSKLELAIRLVREFCGWLDGFRFQLRRRVMAGREC